MEQRFKYNFDKRSKRLTVIITVVTALVLAALIFFSSGGGYLNAWFIAILSAVAALFILSIPRYIHVDDNALEIHCIVEMTRIPIEDISSVRKVTREQIKPLVITLGSYGFFGYYGYYLNLREWETVKVYAREWDHFVEIEDIYEQKYLVSCRQADRLIDAVMQAKLEHAGEETNEAPEE